MSRVVSIFPCCCLVCFCLLPRAALHDSCLSYSCLCASLVYIVFGICLADDPFGRCGIIARQRFILICFGRSLHPSHEAGLLPSPRLAGCPLQMHRGYSRLSAVIGLCRSLWRPLAAAAEGADSSASESACLRRGGHPAERAGSGVWVGTPGPVDLSSPRWAPPLQQSAASTLPEGSHMASCRGKIPRQKGFFITGQGHTGVP